MKRTKTALFSAALLATAVSGAAIQIKDRVDSAGRLQYEVNVALKLIQVYVNDKKGNPVPGLTAGDFEIEDNGRPQKITAFEVHFPPLMSTNLLAPAAPASKPANPSASRTGVRLPRKFFLLIDYFRNDMSGIVMAKTAARHFLETQVLPADETALLAFVPRKGLTVARPLTTDHRSLLEALETMKDIPYLDDGVNPWPKEGSGIDANTILRARADLTNEFSAVMQAFAHYLRSVPGFKNIILYSRGISRDILGGNVAPAGVEGADPSETMEASDWGGKIETGGFTVRNYAAMLRELATAGGSVFAVNTQGLKGFNAPPEERGTDNLKQMTEATGGKYYADAVRYEEIDRSIQETTARFYILGYSVEETWNGGFHALSVKVKGKDYDVRAPQGYFSPKPFGEFTALEKEIHLLSLARLNRSGGPVPYIFGAAAFACPGAEPGRILLLAEIPSASIKDAFGPETEVSIFVLTRDDQVVYSVQGKVNFTGLPDHPVFGYLAIPLVAGDYDCRIVFRDLKTGQAAVAATSLSAGSSGETAGKAFRIFPPLLFRMDSPAAFINLTSQETPETSPEPRLLKQLYHFVSNRTSPVVDGIDRGVKEIMAAVLVSGADAESTITATAELAGDDPNRTYPLEPTVIGSELWGDMRALLLLIELPEVVPGRYALTLTIKNETANAESRAVRTFLIR